MEEPEMTAMPAGFTPAVPFDECFDAQYGLEVVAESVDGDGRVRGRVPVRGVLMGHDGCVHGGVFAAAAEALASRGTALSVIPNGNAAMGLSNDTTTLAPVSQGVIHLEARVLGSGEDAWVWAVEARDDAGRPCAFSRVTVAVRPMEKAH